MKKTILLTAICITSSIGSFAQNVNITDANFKAYLVGNSAINTNSDTEIQISEASSFTGTINCGYLNIANMTGIETFTALSVLNCPGNSFTNLNLSGNVGLISLDCSQSPNLVTMDLSQNVNLENLDLNGNTSLGTIDVSQNTALINLNVQDNYALSLNLSQNVNLQHLNCSYNLFSTLDLSQNTALISLGCVENSLLTSLDLSNNVNLTSISCSNNQNLSVLNLKNINFSTILFASGNPNLTCIDVDDVAAATTAWTNIDATASFSLDCNATSSINDEKASIEIQIFPNPTTTQLNIQTENKVIHAKIIDGIGRTIDINLSNDNIIDVSKLSSGIYQLQIETDKGFAIKKFIKE